MTGDLWRRINRKADEKRGHQRGDLLEITAGFNPLPVRPAIAVPVASALMLPKRNARASLPIIRMNDDAGRWRVVVGLLGVPADISSADDRG